MPAGWRRRRRRLRPDEASGALRRAEPIDPPRAGRVVPTRLAGHDLAGRPLEVVVSSPTLVVFVAAACDACRELASLVATGLEGLEVLGAVRADDVGLARGVGAGRWLVGDHAFDALEVRSAPFFCLLDGDGARTEGVAFGAAYVVEACARSASGQVALRPRN